MSHSPHARPWSRALAVVMSTLLLAGALTTLPATGASAVDGVTVEIVEMSPTVVGPDDTQDVTVQITNDSPDELTGLRAELGVGWRAIPTRTAVATWADAGSARIAARQLNLPLDDLPAGRSAEVTFELRISSLQLGTDATWGPRELSVTVADDGGTIDVQHSFLLYDPDGGTPQAGLSAPPPVDLAMVAPLAGPPLDPTSTELYMSTISERTAPGGMYERLLQAATSATAPLSLAVDPAVVAVTATSGQSDMSSWASRLQRAGAVDVVTLPPYDTDLAALAHAEVSPADVVAATDPTDLLPTDWSVPEAWSTTVAWPQGTVDLETLAAAVSARADTVVVTDGLQPRSAAVAPPTDAVATAAGDVPVVVVDPVLSQVLASGTGPLADAVPTAVTTQRLLADTAVLATTAAEAGTPADAVAALPRGWTPDVATYTAVTETLAAQGWIDVVPLTTVLERPAASASVPRIAPDERVVDDAELAPDTVRDLVQALDDVAAFSTVSTDPATLTASVDRDLVAPLSVSWRRDTDARDAVVGPALARAEQVRSGISVVGRADVTLVSDSGDLPVRIRNDLPVDATVTVVLSPDDPRLIVETTPTVVVPAGESRDAAVRVRAIGSGDVNLEVEVLAPSGTAVTEPTEFAVQVRAGWETVGTSVMAVGVGLLFLAGIWRTVRRGRSDRRVTAEVAETLTPQDPTAPRPAPPAPKDPEA